MLKKSFNMKKMILGITTTAVTIATGIGVYQNLNNGKENNQTSFEQKMVSAAKKYVEDNHIEVEEEIKTTTEYLEKTGDFNREETDGKCADYSYVSVRNENGTYSYEPVLVCENPEESKELNLAIGYIMEDTINDIETPTPVLDYELKYSTKKPTNGNVTVTFTTNFPARILSTTGKLEDWVITGGENGENTVFTKIFKENETETVHIDDIDLGLGTDRTIKINVQNIDRTAPVVTGVEDGKTYTENMKVEFNEGKATLNGESFISGTIVTEGKHVLIVTDEAGNTTTVNFTIDTTAPTITLTSGEKTTTSTGTDNTIVYYNEPVEVEVTDTTDIKSLTYSFNGGEAQEFTSPMTFDKVGTYVITATDSSNETGFTSTKTFVYNTSKPVIKNVKHGGQYKQGMTVIVEDDIPVTATFTLNGGEAQNFKVASYYDAATGKYVTSTELSNEGRYVVSATDAAGNTLEREKTTFIIDWTAPTINGIDHNGYYGNSANVKITLNDNLTNVKDLTAVLTKPDGSTETFVNGSTLENFAHGTYILTVTDRAQNKVEYTFTVDTQNTVEVINKDFDKTITKDPVDVTITFNKPVKITSDNANEFKATDIDALGYASVYVLTISDANVVEFAFQDRLGLTGTDSVVVSNIDVVAPTFIKGETTPAGLTNASEVTVTLTFSEPVKITGENADQFTAVDATEEYATKYQTTVTENTTINFNFVDKAGHTGTGSYAVTNIDRVGPTVTIISNGKREEIKDLTKTYYYKNAITIRFADDREGTVIASYGDITPTPIINGGQIKADGVYTLNVRDAAGNITTVNIVIDTKLPEIELSSGATSATVDNVNVYGGDVTITVTDDTPTTITATLNGEAIEVTGNTVNANGVYVVTVIDAAGNSSEKTFRIDAEKPVVELTSESESFTFNGIEYYSKAVTFKVTDDTNTTVSLTLNGENVEATVNTVSASGVYVLTATDVVGNTATKTFAIDVDAPVITLESAAPVINTETMNYYSKPVTFKVTDDTNVTVTATLNGENVEVTGNTLSTDGVYVLTATDAAGNKASETFTIDTTAPVLEGAAHGKQYKTDSLTINIKDDSPYTATYTLNGGSPVAITGETVLTEEGRYTVVAKDIAGNELKNSSGKASITFIIDRTAPTITGVEDKGYYGKDDKVKITLKDNYSNIKDIKATLTKPDGTKEAFTSGTTLTENGNYTLTVSDKAGNKNTITFTIDKEDITVNTTQDIDTMTSNNVTVTVTFNKPVKITSENVSKFTATNANEAGYASEFTVLMTENGTVDFAFIDQAKNTGTSSFTVNNIDKTAPTFVKGETTPAGLTNASEVTVTLTFSEPVKITVENADQFTAVDAKDGYATTYTTKVTENNTTVSFEFEDKAGLTGTGSYTVTNIDRVGPTITLNSDSEGKTIDGITFYNKPVTIVATDDRSETSALVSTLNDNAYVLGTEIAENGKHTVVVTDEAGNESTITFVIDTEVPTINGLTDGEEINGKTYYKKALNITFTDNSSAFLDRDANLKATYSYNGGEAVEFNNGGELKNDGTYTVTVTDEAGNESTVTFVLDATVPTITDLKTTPEELTKENVKLTVTFSETVTIKTATITIGGETKEVEMTPVNEDKTVYEVIASDNGTIEFTYEDEAGHEGEKGSYEINNIDRTAPEITVNSDSTGKEVEEIKFYNKPVTVTATDNKSEAKDLTATLNGNAYVLGTEITENGKHTVVVTDEAGNESTVTFVIDTEVPTINGLTDGVEVNGKTYYKQALNITFTDNSSAFLDRVANLKATYSYNGGEAVEFNNGGSLSENGTYTVTVTDEAGNESTVTFVLDTEAPTLVKGETTPAGLTNASEVTVTLTFSEPVKITGENADQFTAVDAKDGYATTYTTKATEVNEVINVTFEDVAGHTGTGSYAVTNIDRVGPTITLNSDSEGKTIDGITFYNKPVTVTATDDRSETSALVPTLNDNAYVLGTEIAENGKHTVVVTDEAGNESTVTFVIDTEVPIINGLTDGEEINGKTYYKKALNITFTDNSSAFLDRVANLKATYSYNGGEAVEFNNGGELKNDGTYTVTVTDEAGNTTTVTFVLDATVPTITNLETDPEELTKENVKLTVTFSETVTIKTATITIGGETKEVEMTPVNEDKTVYEVTAPDNGTIEFTYEDEAGHEGEKGSYEINNIDRTAPEITVNSDSTGKEVEGIKFYNKPVTVTATDNKSEAKDLTATLNGNAYVLGTEITENGRHTVVVTDEAGNESTTTFVIDTEVPTINGLTDGVEVNGKTYYKKALNITFTDNSSAFLDRVANLKATYSYNGGEAVEFNNGGSLSENGTYTVTVTDEAGNESTVTFVLDTEAPTLVKGETTPAGLTNASEVTVTLTFSEPVKITGENADQFTAVDAKDGYAITYTTKATEVNEVINVTFEDVAGHTGTGSYTVTNIDRVGPTITLNSDSEGKTIDGITFYNKPVTVTATDDRSETSALVPTLNDNAYVLGTEIAENGKHTVTVTDEAGNESTVTFVIDTEVPTINGLTDGEEINGKTYYKKALNITFTDNSSAFLDRDANLKATYSYNGGEAVEFDNGGELKNDGTYTVTVTDEAGNESTVTFVLDATVPTITDLKTTPEELTKENVKLTVTFSETVTIKTATITIGGETKEVEMTPVNEDKTVYEVIASDNGTIEFTYEDEAKHSGTYSHIIDNIDRTAPEITVNSDSTGKEVEGIKFYNKPVTVIATDNKSEAKDLTATLNGNAYVLGTEITENGKHTVVVTDEAGNESTTTFVIDTGAPIISLDDNSFYKETVEFTVTDATEVTVTVKHTSLTGDVTESTLAKDANGSYSITEDGVYEITATDQAGNTTTRTVTIDTAAPIISVDDNSFHKTDVEFTVTDQTSVTVRVTLDGNEITLNPVDGKYTATNEGVYQVTATDEAGMSATKTFTIDKTAPVAKVDGNEIVNGTVYGTPITFVTDDKTNVTVSSKEGTPSVTKNTDGSYTATENGTYELTLIDQAGNESTVTFIIDKDAPETDLVGEKYYPGKVEFTVTDQTSVTVKAKHTPVGSETATESTITKDENGKYSVTADGFYEITIEDEAGHTITREFAIDSEAPVFNVANNSYHNQAVDLTVTDVTTVDIAFDSTSINGGEANIEFSTNGYTISGDGIYTITATDQAGNVSTVTFTIDTKAPVIKNIEDGKSYQSGVTIEVEDATLATLLLGDTIITNGSTVTGEGTYTVTATDQAGNVTTVTFTVDDTEPTITFPEGIKVEDNAFTTRKEVAKTGSYIGIDPTTITADEKITVTKTITNNAGEEITEIPLTALATYTVTYTIADEAGNTVTVTETVIVEDTEEPVITIDGNISLIIVEKGASVTYPTVTAEDIYEGSVAVTDDRTNVDINTPNDYTVTFTAKDSSNNIATKTITVRVLNLDKLRKEENKLKTLAGFVDPNGDKFGSYNENKDDYTEESWNAKQALIDELNNIINGNSDIELEMITQEFVNEKMNAIEALKLQPKELDLTEYNAQIDRFNKLVETDYTENSWREAEAYKNQSIANIKLQSDLNYFTRSQLKRAIDDLERIDLYDYANATVKKFMADYKTGDYEETVHEAAINKLIFELSLPIMSNHTIMLKSEFDKQVEELRKQVEAARLPIDPTALEELKNDLKENYNEADYTKESWKAIQDLIKDAEKVVADDGLRSEFKEAMDKIDLSNLVLIPKVDETTIGFTSSSNTNYAKLGDTLTLTFSGNKALSNATVTINGKEATVTKTETGFTATVTVEENDQEGKVSYTINPIGEEVTPVTKESNIIVDMTLPTLNISVKDPDGTNNWYKTTPTISIDALEDINGIDYENSYYTVTVNGEEGARNSLLNGETPITTIPLAPEISGEIVVKVVAIDNAGNVTTVSKNLNIDKVLPTITISNPDGSKSETFNGIGEVPTYYFNESVNITAIDNITSVEGYPTITLNGNSYVPGTEFVSNQVNIIEVTDVAGNTTQVKVVVDTEAPTIILTNKENVEATGKDYEEEDGTVTYYKETLNLTIRDNIDKDLTITATFTNVDGEVSDITLAKDENGVYTASLTENGKYVVTVTDDAGYTTTKVFVIDTKAPVVTGVKHGTQYKDETLIVEFDDYSLESATLNKQPFTSGSSIMEEGKHSLVILDKAGNKTTVAFIVDRTAPTVTLTSEEVATEIEDTEKVYYYKKPVTITFEDRGNISQFPVLTGKISFTSDKTDKTDIEEYENRNLLSGTTVEEEGTYTVITKDKAGNTTTVKFIIDQTSPIITKPLAGVYGDAINIEFTEGTAKIGDVEYNNGDSFDVEGTHTLVVTDEAGNKTEVTFTIDKSKPIIEGIPAKGINNSGLEITVTDATKTTVKIDDEVFIDNELIQDGKTFTYDVEGTHTIVAIDAAGNTETVTFTIDKSAPTINGLENPKATDTDADGNVVKKYFDKELELTFNDATAIIVTVNGKEVTLTEDNKYSFQDGEYVVVVTDEAGFTTTETFVIDTKDPIITGVEQDKHYKERPTIEATDDTLASITIDGNPFNHDYAEGEHTVTATDKLGHSTSIKFIYDITAPTITIVDGENAYTEDATITVEASNEAYTIPTATALDTYSGDREVTQTGNVDLTKLGEQTITYTSTDEAGNTRTIVLTVNVVDSEAPTDLNYEIVNGAEDQVNGWYIKPLKVKLSATDNGTGVTKYEYRILNDGTPVTDWVTLEDFAEPTFEMPESINGSKITFEMKAYDKADNSVTKTSSEYQVDQIAPTVTATIDQAPNANDWYKEDINVLLSGNDETSGVTHFLYQISLGNDIWTDEARLEATDGKATLLLNLESSTLSYRVIAVDRAGHRSVVATNDQTLKLDKTAPEITVDGSIKENKTIQVEAAKNGTYTNPTATVTDNFDKNVTVSSNGTVNLKELNNYEVIYTATDEAGNTATIILTVTVDDTEAPVITLNGDEEMTLLYGSNYQDLGATAEDNLDETVKVAVSYDIDSYQTGKTYTVTYTATDKKGNKATATRKVTIKAATTGEVIKNANDCVEGKNCYVKTEKDENNNDITENYVWYSGHLWRIMTVNTDGTVKMITEDSAAGFAYYDGTSSLFKGSYAENWLNVDFYNSLNNPSKYIVEANYCNARGTALNNANETCADRYVVREKVALITLDEYNLLGGANSFLNNGDRFYTITTSSNTALVVVHNNGVAKTGYKSWEPYAMRPVVTLSADVNITSGKGTKAEPYYIQNNETAKANTLLNKRNSGEYVTIGNQTWRIMQTDGTSTRLILDGFFKESGKDTYKVMEYGTYGTFDITKEGEVAHYLNNTVYNTFSAKEKEMLLLTKWYYNGYRLGQNPKKTTLLASTNYTYAYVGLPSVGELMSGSSSTGRVEGLTAWAINYNDEYNGYSWYLTSLGGSDFALIEGRERALRPVIELNPNVIITGGNGTVGSPYQLSYK